MTSVDTNGFVWSEVFASALPYAQFLDAFATPEQRERWDQGLAKAAGAVTDEMQNCLNLFVRRMPILVMCGAWCGDCIKQVTWLESFARKSPAGTVELRLLNRDARPDVRDALMINGGQRVPVMVILSEDGFEVARFGDRPLSTYRRLIAQKTGVTPVPVTIGIAPASATGGNASPEEILMGREWLDVIERAQWILRLSPRLRQKHGD